MAGSDNKNGDDNKGNVATGGAPANPPVQPVNVVVQNIPDRKIKKKFDGTATTTFAHWKLLANQVLERIKDGETKLWTIVDALEGNALSEIQRHRREERDSADKVFQLLEAKYADRRTPTQIMRGFYSLVQMPGQTVLEFADTLTGNLHGVEKKLNLNSGELDNMLRDQFCENVVDPTLRWELRKEAQKSGTFDEVRTVALEWESGQSRQQGKSGPKAAAGCFSAASDGRSDELELLRQMVKSQQDQINKLVEGQSEVLRTLQLNNQGQDQVGQGPSGQGFRREARSCYYCGKPGHLAYQCRKKKQDMMNRNQNQDGAYQQNGTGGQGNGQSLSNPQQGRP